MYIITRKDCVTNYASFKTQFPLHICSSLAHNLIKLFHNSLSMQIKVSNVLGEQSSKITINLKILASFDFMIQFKVLISNKIFDELIAV
jgi:hypothetical protein